MTKKYQKNEIDTPTDGDGFVVPERVSVAMAEIAGAMRDGLLALAVGTGLQVMQVLMEAEGAVVGPDELLERAWDEGTDPFTNTVRMTVMTLRRKLGDPPVVHTVRGAGYRV